MAPGAKSVRAVGLVGADLFGEELLALLRRLGAGVDGMLRARGEWQTMVYAKPCIGQVEQNRIDFGGFNAISAESVSALADVVAGGFGEQESDYADPGDGEAARP